MRLLSLNIWEGTVGQPLMDFVKEQSKNVEVFCFQEATDDIRKKIGEFLVDYNLVSADKELAKGSVFNQATYIKNNLKVLNSCLLLKEEDDTGLSIYSQIMADGKILNICNVHGMAWPGDKLDTEGRLKQSRIIIEFLKNIDGAKIVTGDFNLELDTQSVRMFENNGFRNLVKEYKIQTTRNGLSWKKYPDNKQLWADYMFVSSEIKVLNFLVPNIEVSDHLPLMVEIE